MSVYGAVGMSAAALLCFYFLLATKTPGLKPSMAAGTVICAVGAIGLFVQIMLSTDPPELELLCPCGGLMLIGLWAWRTLWNKPNDKSKKGRR